MVRSRERYCVSNDSHLEQLQPHSTCLDYQKHPNMAIEVITSTPHHINTSRSSIACSFAACTQAAVEPVMVLSAFLNHLPLKKKLVLL